MNKAGELFASVLAFVCFIVVYSAFPSTAILIFCLVWFGGIGSFCFLSFIEILVEEERAKPVVYTPPPPTHEELWDSEWKKMRQNPDPAIRSLFAEVDGNTEEMLKVIGQDINDRN
jgi:hypothetical protein